MDSCPFCNSGLDKINWEGDIGYDSYLCGTRVEMTETVRTEVCKSAEIHRLRAVNAELLASLKALFAVSTPHIAECGQSPWQIAKAAIEKHGKGE